MSATRAPTGLTMSVIILASSVLAGATASPAATVTAYSDTSESPAVLRIASQDDIKGLNPFGVNDVWSSNVIYTIFDRTVNQDWKTGELQPWVAVEWCTESKLNPGGCSVDEADADPLNITVRYKVGDWAQGWGGPVRFHDGVEVTLDDILFSYQMVPYNGRWFSSVKDLLWKASEGYDWNTPPFGDTSFQKITVGGVGGEPGWLAIRKKPGETGHALEFKLKQPYTDFFQDTLSTLLFPEHIWQKHIDTVTGTGDYLTWEFDYNAGTGQAPGMIGSGPFKFNKWVKGQFTKIDRNPEYFDWTKLPKVDARGRIITGGECAIATSEYCAYDPAWSEMHPTAYIDGVEYKIYLTTESAALALQQADVDYVGWPIPPSMINEMQFGDKCTDLNNVKVNCGRVIGLEKTSERGFTYTGFNMRRIPFGYDRWDPVNPANMTDVGKPLRHAIAYSTDKETIVSQVLQGYGKVALGPVSPDLPLWYNDSLPAYLLNESKANALLDAAGWARDPSCPKIGNPADHGRRLPGAGCAIIEMLSPELAYDPWRFPLGQMIEAAAQKVGINLKSVPTAFGKIVTQIQLRNFDMYNLGWRIGSDPGGYFRSFFHCTEEKSGNNYLGYCNPELDRLMDEFDRTTDQIRRIQIIKDAQGLLVDDLPLNVVYYRVSVEAFRKDRFVVPYLSPHSWIKGITGVYHSWTLLLIRPPGNNPTVMLAGPTSATCGRALTFSATVTFEGQRVHEARVDVRLSPQLSLAGGANGTTQFTDPQGVVKFTVFVRKEARPSNELIDLSVSKSGFVTTQAIHKIAVQVCENEFIPFGEIWISPQAISPGHSAKIEFSVFRASDSRPFAGVRVEFLKPMIGQISPSSLMTGADGVAKTYYTLPAAIQLNQSTKVRIVATPFATFGGQEYAGDPVDTEILVTPLPPTSHSDSSLVVMSSLIVATIVAAVAARSLVLRRMRHE